MINNNNKMTWNTKQFHLHKNIIDIFLISAIITKNFITTDSSVMAKLKFIKRSQLGAFCKLAIAYCYLEFKLRYLQKTKQNKTKQNKTKKWNCFQLE